MEKSLPPPPTRPPQSRVYKPLVLGVVLLCSLLYYTSSSLSSLPTFLSLSRHHSHHRHRHHSHHFPGPRIQDLPTHLLPGGPADPHARRRLIFIGDIHGCLSELRHLLHTLDFHPATDHLIPVGDVISKGPHSPAVLDALLARNATPVRGNHEARILALPHHHGSRADRRLRHHLSPPHLAALHAMPLILRIPPLPRAPPASPLSFPLLVVHAGLVPGLPLARQTPYFVMNMRSIRPHSCQPLVAAADKHHRSRPWHQLWDRFNRRALRRWRKSDAAVDSVHAPHVVVYGHHAKAGLRINTWSKGLDSGCVRGGQLSALVLDAHARERVVQVECPDRR